MTARRLPRADATTRGRQATGLRLLVGLTIALAVAGIAVAGVLLAGNASGGAKRNAPGEPIETSFGAFTVTNVKMTFVPDTQGPPTAAQHNGTKGSNQLQVWVRLVNDRAEKGLAYTPAQLRLLTTGRSGHGLDPNGSSFRAATLPRGGSIDGQVWFDLPRGTSTDARWSLEFTDPGGGRVRVPLGRPQVAPAHVHQH